MSRLADKIDIKEQTEELLEKLQKEYARSK
jgi:hypothetical protein